MKKRQFYLAPEADAFELKLEGIICQSLGGDGIAPGTLDDWGTFDEPGILNNLEIFQTICLMKKYFTILFATAVAALAFVSCQKSAPENNEDENGVKTSVHFYASEIETKTVFGDLSAGSYPTLWTNTKGIMISQNKAASVEATVTPKEGGAKADFAPSSAITSDGSGNYVFYALSPSSAQVSKINQGYNSWNIEIPTSQTPLIGSVDESAQILFAKYNAGTEYPTSVPFAFKHVTAYGKLSFTNLTLDGDENVTGVTLTAESNWVGRWYYYVEDYDAEPADGTPENEEGTVAPSSASKTLSLITTSTSNIWFACAPVDLRSKALTAIVATNKGTYTKQITFPADKGNFQAGHVASFSINMDGVTRVSPVVYTEVTDVASLTVGSEIIITNATATYAAGLRGTGKFLGQQAVTLSDSKISDPSASVEVFTIGNGNIAGTYSLNAGSESKYLKYSDGASIGTEASLTDASSWAIYISGGVTTIRNMSENGRFILYNSGSSRFTTYLTTTEGVSAVKIYKKTGTGSAAITAKTASSISVSGANTEYTVGDTYSFDGTVTLTYSDLSEKVLTSTEYTLDSSAVDMSTADAYTITITYNANPSISTSYTINVTSGSAFTVWSDDFSSVSGTDALSSLSGSKTGYTSEYSGLSNVYSMTGSIRIGTSKKTGTITTPALSSITKTGANLTITFKAAGWNAKTTKITLTASKGTVTEGQTTIASESTMSSTTPYMTGTEYTFHVTGADNTTKITLATTLSIGIDDLLIQQTN